MCVTGAIYDSPTLKIQSNSEKHLRQTEIAAIRLHDAIEINQTRS